MVRLIVSTAMAYGTVGNGRNIGRRLGSILKFC